MRKICFVTGSRADYGLLNRLMSLVDSDASLKLQIIATNMHLAPEFGFTLNEIQSDGFKVDKKVEMLLSSDSCNATTKSIGLATIGFADAFEDLKPEIIVLLGDRYELLAAASAALIFKIPIAHIHGGEITEGAYDDSIRHAVTKLSHVHFTSTDEYRKRVIQMGEQPSNVFNVGAIGIDNIMHSTFLSKKEIEDSLNFKLDGKCILVTYHPETMVDDLVEENTSNLIKALGNDKNLRVIFTSPNSDTNGRIIQTLINSFVRENPDRSVYVPSLGQQKYFSVLKYVVAVVGNSSSGIIEVPSFKIPTLNIGARQRGRLASESVVNCSSSDEEIAKNLKIVTSFTFREKCRNAINPYQKENTADEIKKVLMKIELKNLVKKCFYNLPYEEI